MDGKRRAAVRSAGGYAGRSAGRQTGTVCDAHHLLVRLHAERGAQDYTFVWDAARDGKLLGITGANLETRLPFFAEASGGWASFDRTSGASMPLRVEEGRLVLGRGEGAIRAERKAAGTVRGR